MQSFSLVTQVTLFYHKDFFFFLNSNKREISRQNPHIYFLEKVKPANLDSALGLSFIENVIVSKVANGKSPISAYLTHC